MKLTAPSVRTLALPEGVADRTYFDDELPGFGLRLRSSGSRTWVIQYKVGAKHRRLPLGSITELDVSKARARARDLLAAVRLGKDPFADKLETRAKAAETFGALLPAYLDHKRAALRPRTMVEIERHLMVQARPLHPRAVQAIDRRAITALLSQIKVASGPVAANRAHESLRAFFGWARRAGLIEANPAEEMNREAEQSRDRVLDAGELREIWHALRDDRYGAIVKLLALLGCRREEIGGLRWAEVDLSRALITLPPGRVKTKRAHTIPLSLPAVAILESQPHHHELVFGLRAGAGTFSDWSGQKRELDARIADARAAAGLPPMAPWRLHDFRHTASTVMNGELGILPHVTEAVLGHAVPGIAGRYNHASYDADKAAALARWGEHLMAIVDDRERKVVPLKARVR
jgi:integrase